MFGLAMRSAVDQVRGDKAEHTLLPDIPSDAWNGWLRTRLEAEFQPASASLWPSEWAIILQPPPEGGRADSPLDLQPQPERQPLARRQSGPRTRPAPEAARFDDKKETNVPHTHVSDHVAVHTPNAAIAQ